MLFWMCVGRVKRFGSKRSWMGKGNEFVWGSLGKDVFKGNVNY